MKEAFLHFVWLHQYFDKRDLKTYRGQKLQVLNPGVPNVHSGPDFIDCRIRMGSISWAGPLEVHVKASDWYRHMHQDDPAYDRVVLHVVWVRDTAVRRKDGQPVPTLELKGRISTPVLLRQELLSTSDSKIPCDSLLSLVSKTNFYHMLDRCMAQRLDHRMSEILRILERSGNHWDEVCYRVLGKNFGFFVNSEAFGALVRAVPLAVARKHCEHLLQLEALYFGQAGMLGRVCNDPYYRKLQQEYRYLKRKLPGLPMPLSPDRWRFLRLRPANFPTLRIAQFTAFMQSHGSSFSAFRDIVHPHQLRMIRQPISLYWRRHYDFGRKWTSSIKSLGTSSLENIAINTVVPLQAAYAKYTGQKTYRTQADELLKQLPAESNKITAYWKRKGFTVTSAYYSQALIELNKTFCEARSCLRCSIGASLVRKDSRP